MTIGGTHFSLEFHRAKTMIGAMKTPLLLLLGIATLALASCGPCPCNAYNKDLLYDVTPTTSKTF